MHLNSDDVTDHTLTRYHVLLYFTLQYFLRDETGSQNTTDKYLQ